ncbi:MAG: D-alanyl-D-alanine carboxypeptidase precursor [Sphingomonas bacterium]|uniref:serine hydrolase domain-containing protein n=1 Tax=Sphingomonas bacterium TaxID=1895847 RepID=UPI0026179CF8|nr:serine hydrolase domain-containing protein [Sphingomonas bacterium]MDB5696510.1 D-alanyl-D-alanine carboxypeptidase precursor [Sphingomonas bacterium]
MATSRAGWLAIALATTGMTGAGAVAQTAAAERVSAAEVERIVAASFPADAPGAAVIVMLGGRTLYAGGRGLADTGGARAITPDTPIRLGSITKQIVAAVVLQLVAEGRVRLDDPLSRFFPDWPSPGANATVRQLLNHSSGLQDFSKIPGWMLSPPSLQPNSTADLIALIRSRPAVSPPGERWEYNNGGYVVLGAIVEQVTGKPWHQAVVERIGRPLGLKTLAYAEASTGAARGYSREGGAYAPARGVHISVAGAAGGLVASVADLARWARALHGGRVVSRALYAEMIAPARLTGGGTEPYGFGLRLRELRGRPALVHGGSGRGLDAASAWVPAAELFVAVLANTDDPATDPDVLVQRLAALAMGQPVPSFTPVDPPANVAALFGTYQAERGPALRFFPRDGKLWLGRDDDEQEAFAAGDDRFFFGAGSLTWFQFRRDGAGVPVVAVHRVEAAGPTLATRTGDAPAPVAIAPAVLARYVGTFKTEAPVVSVALSGDGRLTIAAFGQSPTPLRPVSATEFRVEGGIMRVVFHPEGNRVDRLTLIRGARELHGTRVTS